jgi:hypothetical protein
MNKSFSTLTFAAALAASLAAAFPAEARGPYGIRLPLPPPGVHFRPHLPPIPQPPFFAGPPRYGTVWLPDRYDGEWLYADGDWRRHPHRYATWSRADRNFDSRRRRG